MHTTLLALAVRILSLSACDPAAARPIESPPAPPPETRIDGEKLHAHVVKLADDSFEGRRVGTLGGAKAREYVIGEFKKIGLAPAGESFTQPFPLGGRRPPNGDGASSAPSDAASKPASAPAPIEGTNVLGLLRGTKHPDQFIVLSAHYDHLGTRNGKIFHGADDNASGVAAMLEIARYLSAHKPQHSVLFAAFDAEESGLQGARAFVARPTVPKDAILLDVNLDMVGRNDKNELYVCGTVANPGLRPFIEKTRAHAPVKLLIGHDGGPGVPRHEDWTSQSDQGAFAAAGIPFLYFGEEDHPDYHKPTDEASRIGRDFHRAAAETILDALLALDAGLNGTRPAPK